MIHLRKTAILASLCATLITGCNERDIPLGLRAQNQTFLQNPDAATANVKIDVLFIIDDSGSMNPYQTNLANNFDAFINDFVTQGYDFNIGVTTTSVGENSGDPDTYVKGKLLPVPDTDRTILTEEDPNLIADFQDLAMVGTYVGTQWGDERPFQALEMALVDRMNDGTNTGFRRDDAFLAVIIITDEDDHSRDQPVGGPSTDFIAPSYYKTLLDNLSNSSDTIKNYHVSAIAAYQPECYNAYSNTHYAQRIEELMDLAEGTKGSVCDTEFADSLQMISETISVLSSRFELASVPQVDTIDVTVNGASVANDSDNGWTYDAPSNSIFFHGSAIPPQGAEISVFYIPEGATD